MNSKTRRDIMQGEERRALVTDDGESSTFLVLFLILLQFPVHDLCAPSCQEVARDKHPGISATILDAREVRCI